MNITIEPCKPDTYVGCPAPATVPPECADGWEIGNGTIVCAAPPPLAATGLPIDPMAGIALSFALILVGAIGLASSRVMIQRGREKTKAAKR